MEVNIKHIYREANSVANSLAKQWAVGTSTVYFHVSEFPTVVRKTWIGDTLGVPVWRK